MGLLVFTGAGVSAESGLLTFRDSDGMWEEYSVFDVATPEAWDENPELVHEFYNMRRDQLVKAKPNPAHHYIAGLADKIPVTVVTQNVDDLHERAGSKGVLHLHGELMKSRCENHPEEIFALSLKKLALSIKSKAPCGHRLRPHVVWFGEAVPAYEEAVALAQQASAMLVIGTSLGVYPAAGLLSELPAHAPLAYLDPGPLPTHARKDIFHIQKKATRGLEQVEDWLKVSGLI